ncbi:MAG: PEGA domain-containing protein [Spirochaetaceae bacterium]
MPRKRFPVAGCVAGAFCAAALVLIPAPTAEAAGGGELDVDVEIPHDERDEYLVGFQVFSGEDLSEENELLARSIPRLLRERLSTLPEHELSDAEREAIARSLLDEAIRKAGDELDAAVAARAELRFETGREDTRRRRIEAAEEKVAEARAKLDAVRAVDPGTIEVAERKPLSFDEEDAEPFDPDELRARLAREEDLDLLVTGSIEELDGSIVVDVQAYNRFLERVVYEETFVGEPGGTDALVAPVREDLAEVFLGRPWGTLSVTTSRDDTAVYVDDRLVGFGEVTVDYARTGRREVRVARDGIDERSRVVNVRPSRTTEVDLSSEVREADTVRIESRPSGADVYLGSIWQGVTPITLARPEATRTVILSRDGFLDETVVLSRAAPDRVSRELVPDPGNWPELVQERRDRFYRAFGWFALSIPVPVMLNGMYQDIAALYPGGRPSPELSDEEARRLAGTANTLLWSARGTAAVSTGLFVNMMVHLIQYIRAGQYAHD